MADTKITSLQPPQAGYSVVPATDVLPIVVIADPGMATSGSTRKVTVNQLLGAGGTATLASATITGAATVGTTLGVTGDLTVGTNALKVFPATNRVLINQTTAIQGDSLEITAKTNAGAISLFGRASDNQSVISFRANGAATQKAGIQGGDVGLEFVAGTTIKQTINPTTGDITVSLGNLVMGTANKGIDFSINSDASATSELLNDYEEGTWTGTLKGSVSDPTTPVTATGKYTKVGRQVSVQISFETVSTVGASGELGISGLPFANSSGIRIMGTAGAFLGATFSGTLITAISASGSTIDYQSVVSNAAWSNATHNAGTGRFFWANITYTV